MDHVLRTAIQNVGNPVHIQILSRDADDQKKIDAIGILKSYINRFDAILIKLEDMEPVDLPKDEFVVDIFPIKE